MISLAETYFFEKIEKILSLHYFESKVLTPYEIGHLKLLLKEFYSLRKRCGRKDSGYCGINECCFAMRSPVWLNSLCYYDLCHFLSENKDKDILKAEDFREKPHSSKGFVVQGGLCSPK